jgi:hypothetical protein
MAAIDVITKPSKRRTLLNLFQTCTVDNRMKTEILSFGEDRYEYKICAITEAHASAQGLLAVINTQPIFREFGVGLMSNQ